jgi:protein-S-isoprenylcysteine O-methyltransferase Ste14
MTGRMYSETIGRRSFWAAAVFYIVIGFEFLYMAGPFAAYFYSVYRPGLNFLNETPALSGLTRFFMPHIVADTASTFVNWHNTIGAILAISGFVTFLLSAGQVYYHKVARKGAVTGGIYRIIRHPQYASFVVCGLGMLFLWPRYVILVMFVIMLFFYYWLARVEEHECEDRYGESYRAYKASTGMFLPVPFSLDWARGSRWKRRGVTALLLSPFYRPG